jgi:hypothetical protein
MGSRNGRTAASFIWAAVPFVSFGFATAPAFLYPAIRLRKPVYWITVAVYVALMTLALSLPTTEESSATDGLLLAAILLSWLGGTAHALAIRSRVFPSGERYGSAVELATRRRELRRAARDAARDPGMAWELRIGRPDLPRGFDDGGLVDVNHAPPAVLASLPGMTPQLVNRIVEVRDKVSGFSSAEELSALAQLPPNLTDPLNEYAIFL